jgi:hypothetical protein
MKQRRRDMQQDQREERESKIEMRVPKEGRRKSKASCHCARQSPAKTAVLAENHIRAWRQLSPP